MTKIIKNMFNNVQNIMEVLFLLKGSYVLSPSSIKPGFLIAIPHNDAIGPGA